MSYLLIYLFDQILKSRFSDESEILDAGCGGGRNIVYFLRSGCPVFTVDENPEAIEYVRALARALAPKLSSKNFQIAKIEEMPFADEQFDAVISSAVLHFAESQEHFDRMLQEMWRVLKKDGLLFVRLASSIGIEDKIKLINGRRFRLPDGSLSGFDPVVYHGVCNWSIFLLSLCKHWQNEELVTYA